MNETNDICPICGSRRIEKFAGFFMPFISTRVFGVDKKDTGILHCKDCNFYCSEVRPTSEQMECLYTDYRGEEYQKQRQSFEPEYTVEFNASLGGKESERSRKDGIFATVNKFCSPEEMEYILDYGGDRGQFFPEQYAQARRYVYDISGVETVEGVECLTSIQELAQCPWNLILCCHVLEHLSYPREEIRKIFNIMPVGGYLYVEVPYEDYFYPCILRKEAIPVHEHINFFNERSLYALFNDPHILVLELEKNDSILKIFVKKINYEDILYKYLNSKMFALEEKYNRITNLNKNLTLREQYYIDNIGKYEIILTEIKKSNAEMKEYIKRYPRWMINLLACFVPKQKNRRHLREKYSR